MLATSQNRNPIKWRAGLAACFALLSCALAAPMLAQETAATTAQAYYEEALAHELYGRNAERNEMLTAAVTSAPELETARWHLGQIEVDGEWLSHADLMDQARANPRLAEYQERRVSAADTVEDQIALARWCRAYGLQDRGRLHWQNVLRLDPSSAEAARRLGLIQHDGRWVTRDIRDAERQDRYELARAEREWRTKLERCSNLLQSGSPGEREAVVAELADFNDPWAIPLVEELYLHESNELARVGIELLKKIEHPWASESLAFLAIYTEDTSVRSAASLALRERSLFYYMPQLISGLTIFKDPHSSEFTVEDYLAQQALAERMSREAEGFNIPGRDIAILIQDEYFSAAEAQNANTIAVLQIALNRTDITEAKDWADWWENYVFTEAGALPTGARQTIPERYLTAEEVDVQLLLGITANFEHYEPYPTRQLDGYAYAAPISLTESEARQQMRAADTTPQVVPQYDLSQFQYQAPPKPPATLEDIRFWLSTNLPSTESYYQEQAEARARMREISRLREERMREISRLEEERMRASRTATVSTSTGCECFVAGTLVWTETGARPIEDIEIGDCVLAKDVETGELAFQLVMTRTERTAPEMVTLVTSKETIVTTPGHLFWVSGVGWKMARELRSGDVLHGVTGTDIVSDIIFDPAPAYVYNLVVDDANTYFVGASQLLVHDATSRKWSQALVPGLVLIEE